MLRVPLFVWGVLITNFLLLLGLGVVLITPGHSWLCVDSMAIATEMQVGLNSFVDAAAQHLCVPHFWGSIHSRPEMAKNR